MKVARTVRPAAVTTLVALAFGFAASGCGGSDDDRLQASIKIWKEGALAKDVDKIMSIVSTSFSHSGPGYEAGSTPELREYLVRSINEGNFDDVDVSLDKMKIEIKGAEASAYPIGWKTPKSSIMLKLIFTKEGDTWRLTDMVIGTNDERRGAPKNATEAMAWFDKNGDGRITTDEMPEGLRKRAKVMDANGDGSLTEEELEAAFQRMGYGG